MNTATQDESRWVRLLFFGVFCRFFEASEMKLHFASEMFTILHLTGAPPANKFIDVGQSRMHKHSL